MRTINHFLIGLHPFRCQDDQDRRMHQSPKRQIVLFVLGMRYNRLTCVRIFEVKEYACRKREVAKCWVMSMNNLVR